MVGKPGRHSDGELFAESPTAPGSQNGFDNSGRKGPVDWQQGSTVSQTLTAIANLAERYAGDTDVVTAIELLNEPLGPDINLDELKQFYYDGWGNVRNNNAYTVVTIHDAFEDITSYWNGFMNAQAGVNNVMLDTHIYQVSPLSISTAHTYSSFS